MIAHALNAEGVPGPRGNPGGGRVRYAATSSAVRDSSTTIFTLARLIWNRQQFIKEPSNTGNRLARLNPESGWEFHEVPKLRIVEDALWSSVKERQASLPNRARGRKFRYERLVDRRRPRHLLSGLVRCGCCSGGYCDDFQGSSWLFDTTQQGRVREQHSIYGATNSKGQC